MQRHCKSFQAVKAASKAAGSRKSTAKQQLVPSKGERMASRSLRRQAEKRFRLSTTSGSQDGLGSSNAQTKPRMFKRLRRNADLDHHAADLSVDPDKALAGFDHQTASQSTRSRSRSPPQRQLHHRRPVQYGNLDLDKRPYSRAIDARTSLPGSDEVSRAILSDGWSSDGDRAARPPQPLQATGYT